MSEIYWLNQDSRKFLARGYLFKDEAPEQRMQDIADAAEKYLNISGFSNKFLNYLHEGFYSLSSPIWSNFGRDRGLPISCFGSYIPDDMEQILYKVAEVGTMSKVGGGTSGYFGDIRPRGASISSGGTATGVHPQLTVFESLTNYVSQSNVRRGSFAAYLPVEHPDIEEFLRIRSEGDAIQDLSIGVCITDEWMESMLGGDTSKRSLWGKIIKKRYESGYPYIFWTDTANNNAPQVYRDKNKKIHASNLCTEIFLSTSDDESFVCDLSSLNLTQWDKIKNTDAIETLVYFLDAVMEEFIEKTDGVHHMEAPRKFAMSQRALGVGVLGWHTYLQQKRIPFESMEAKFLNTDIFKTIQTKTELASTEPLNSNYFTKDLAKGKFTYKNPELVKLLKEKDKDDRKTWKSILVKGGSVQHLDFLSENEKDIFKTFGEISQKEIIIQAAARQKYIDQGQSLNLMIPPNTRPKEVNELLTFAWQQGIKSLYYQRSANPAQELARSILTCASCEG